LVALVSIWSAVFDQTNLDPQISSPPARLDRPLSRLQIGRENRTYLAPPQVTFPHWLTRLSHRVGASFVSRGSAVRSGTKRAAAGVLAQ
jgi:hypothetical protein